MLGRGEDKVGIARKRKQGSGGLGRGRAGEGRGGQERGGMRNLVVF